MLNDPIRSFWMGGFECSDQLNALGDRVNMLEITDHLNKLADDYALLRSFGITTVREGICWSQVETAPYVYDFSTVKQMLAQGMASGIQQIWDICHFGFPDDLSPLHPHFTQRFVALCIAFVEFYRAESPDGQLIITPINEVSFLSWLGGEAGGTTPYCKANGWNVKYALVKAYIQSIKAMKALCPKVLILTTEPIVSIVPPIDPTPEQILHAAEMNQEQYQAVDMLMGRICPELGGAPELIDILGVNFYYNNQWILGFNEFLPWLNEENDPRWRPLADLVAETYERYQKPIILSETSHPGEDRPLWVKFITAQTLMILHRNIPFWGICLYPIIDRPDWDDLDNWHHSGLWDQQLPNNKVDLRILDEPYAEALALCQEATSVALANLADKLALQRCDHLLSTDMMNAQAAPTAEPPV